MARGLVGGNLAICDKNITNVSTGKGLRLGQGLSRGIRRHAARLSLYSASL